jgi:hypothetical protein
MVQVVIFLRKFLTNLGFPQTAPIPVFADNETCMVCSEGSVDGSDSISIPLFPRESFAAKRRNFPHNLFRIDWYLQSGFGSRSDQRYVLTLRTFLRLIFFIRVGSPGPGCTCRPKKVRDFSPRFIPAIFPAIFPRYFFPTFFSRVFPPRFSPRFFTAFFLRVFFPAIFPAIFSR